MRKFIVVMKREFYVSATDENMAEREAINICASDSEALMPHNMNIEIKDGSALPDSLYYA